MKALLALALLLATTQTSMASSPSVPDCYRAKNVIRGQFLVLLTEGLSKADRTTISIALGDLDLGVVGTVGDDTLLGERAALSQLSRKEELATLAGLQALIGQGVDAIGCNGLSRSQ